MSLFKKWYNLIFLLFVLALVLIESINKKFFTNDLKVYYGALNDYKKGVSPYLNYYGLETGFFKYPPPSLLFFYPMNFFTFEMVRVIHTAFILFAIIGIFYYLTKSKFYGIILSSKAEITCSILSFLCIAVHLTREMHLGNVNVFLVFFLVASIYFYKINKNWSSFLITFLIFLKPISVFVLIPLLVFDYKLLVKTIFLSVGLIAFQLLINGKDLFDLWMGWFESLKNHSNQVFSSYTFDYIFNYFFGIKMGLQGLLFLFVAIQFLLFLILKKVNKENATKLWMMINLSLIPNFIITDEQHFLMSLPLIFVILCVFSELKVYEKIILIIGLIFYSVNSKDLMGPKLNSIYEANAILGLSNLIIIIVCLLAFSSKERLAIDK